MPSENLSGLPLVEAKDVTMRFGNADIIDHVSLAIHSGEIVTLIGPNGSGKTTLVRIVLGLQAPTSGAVTWRKYVRVGYVPQHFSVDATLPLTVRRLLRLSADHTRERSRAILEEIGIRYVLDRPVHSLSGGELRRVLLARALLREPDLLVLDEPTAGVDVAGQAELYELIRALRDKRHCGILMVSHDLHLVMAATDRVICVNHHICCEGRPETVSRAPEYLALFGDQAARTLAVYAHAHDHRHDVAGHPVRDDVAGHPVRDDDSGRPVRDDDHAPGPDDQAESPSKEVRHG
ncbi:MAG: zinc ABC transporter ATP-binding protein ZnuC [Rhodospirillales bacterium]